MNLILNFIKKEFLQFKRDKRMFGIILIAPVIQLIFLGYAATLDVKNVKTVVWDQDRSVSSRKFLESYESSGYFTLKYYVTSYRELTELIDNGEAIMAIIIPVNFERDILGGRSTKLQTIFDGSDGNKALIAAGYSQGITISFASGIVSEFIESDWYTEAFVPLYLPHVISQRLSDIIMSLILPVNPNLEE